MKMIRECWQCECGFAVVCNIKEPTVGNEICACGKEMKQVDDLDLSTDESGKLSEQDKLNIEIYGDKGGLPSIQTLNMKLNKIMEKLGIEY